LQRTFADHYHTATGVAAALRDDMNVHEDGCVAMYCPNHVDYLGITLGVALAGTKCTPINPLATERELTTLLDQSHSTVLFAHTSGLVTAMAAAKNSKHVKHVVAITDTDEFVPSTGVELLDTIRSHPMSFDETIQNIHRKTETHPFWMPYSSGTTGLPKGVCLTHSNIVSNLMQMEAVEDIGFAEDHKVISPLPFYHIYAFTYSLLYPAWKGNTVITTSGRFDLEKFCQLVQEHRPQRAHLVPPIILGLAKSPMVDQYDLSSLRVITSAAAPLSSDTEGIVAKRFGCVVKQAWGMSELSPLGTVNSDYNAKPGSVGPLAPSTIAKVVDEHGRSLGPNEVGELMIKGPQVMIGYLNDPDRTAECLSDSGWLRTGDVAYYDEESYFFITDRLKELIKVRGYPVAPAELEALLLTHEAVNDAAVIPKPDEASGELPRAYVVLKDTEEARKTTEQNIYEWVKDRVTHYKRLDGGIVLVDTIPKSASGKILRRILRDQLKEESK
jgi:4-coumarate--CoA ligase